MSFSSNGIFPVAGFANVTPVTVVNDPGLTFSILNFSSGSGTATATIAYTITAPSSDPMTDASLAVTGTAINFGDSETLSNGQSLSASESQLTASTTFAAATSLTVTNALSVHSGSFTSFTNRFSETPTAAPEPSSLALLGVGLSALGFVRRRKRR